jgi:hypothetical protein
LSLGHFGTSPSGTDQKLLDLPAAQVAEIDLAGPADAHLTLKKTADGWIMPDHFAAVVDAGKVSQLLTTLDGMSRPWPVATSSDAEKRFQVEDKNFERKLVFRTKDKVLATLLLGSSPGFRKVHARLSGETNVYDIPFSTYQASCKPEDWIDHELLKVKPDEVSTITLANSKLVRHDGKLQLVPLAENERTNTVQAQKLLEDLAGLSILDVYGKADQLPKPAELKAELTLKDGSNRSYQFAKGDKAGEELLQVAGSPFLYKVTPGLIKDLQQFDRARLVQANQAADQDGDQGLDSVAAPHQESPARGG